MGITQTIELATTPSYARDPLEATLLASRQRWRGFGLIAADLLFETDLAGRLTFLAPDPVLGWPASALLGNPLETLLAKPDKPGGTDGSNPFHCDMPLKNHRVWLHDAAGRAVCMAVSSAPLLDHLGQRIGTRGIGVDVTEQEKQDATAAASRRRGDVLGHILGQIRQEITAPSIMPAVLDALMRAVGGQGAAVLDLTPAPVDTALAPPWPVLHHAGDDPLPVLADALALLEGENDAATAGTTSGGQMILACPASMRFGERAGLVVWRAAGSQAWDADDHKLAASVTGVIRIMLEHEAVQRELAQQARTDPLTGLLNRRAFMDEASRRIDRLDREELPGTLLVVDLDGLKALNDRLGHEAGDAALLLVAELLRRTVRPADLVARLGGDEFALWLDGSDELTAAERAEALQTDCPQVLAHLSTGQARDMTMSIGIACRKPGSGEPLDSLLQRADQAMYEVKRAGRGHWRVSHKEPAL